MKTRLLATAVAVALPSLAAAQELSLPPIVVTASRTAQMVDEALAAVTVITREDIERQQPQSVLEVLRGTPGLHLYSSGGLGKRSALFLRGSESDHTLVLIDGIKVGDPTAGSISWQDLPIDQVERIEIVRGPRSSLYGSEAIGGVIQIFTRKGGGKPRLYGSAGYGSDGTHKSHAGLAGGGERSWFNLSLSHLESDGFDAWRDQSEPDDDGYRSTSVLGRLGSRFGQTGEAEISILRAEGRNDYDGMGPYANQNDFVEQTVGARLSLAPLAHWRTSLAVGNARSEREYFQDGHRAPGQDLAASRYTLSWQNELVLAADHLVVAGVDYQRDKAEGDMAFTVAERDNKAGFIEYQGGFGSHSLQLAVRHDDNEQFGGHTTGSLAWGYQWTPTASLFASYGTGFNAPTLQDLHVPWGGNLNLEPEESRSVELGIQGRNAAFAWSFSLFQTKIDNLIVPDASWNLYNLAETRIRGAEATLETRVLGWQANLSLTLLDPENRYGDNRGNLLPRRSRQSGRIDLDRTFGRFSVGGSVFAESHRYDDPENNVRLGGYALLDLRASYAFNRDWSLRAMVGNVLDKDYETAAGYNQPGRTWFVSLHYAPVAR